MKTFVIRYSTFVILLLFFWGCQKKFIVPAPPPAPKVAEPESSVPQAVAPSTAPPTREMPAAPSESPSPETWAPREMPETQSEIAAGRTDLQDGEKYFRSGNYKQAALSFEKFLALSPKSQEREQALFYLGLSSAISSDSNRGMVQAEAALRRLIIEFPRSPYRRQAEYMLALQSQIDKLRADVKERDDKIKLLNEELQKLKEIDLQRRPRPGE
jgi:TolA-binding protein